MIRFFNTIRYQLASENLPAGPASRIAKPASRTLRYMRYAIGEILLVVIGILIALQINIWNEEAKINKSIAKHLIVLRQNILEDQNQLRELQQNMKEAVNYSDSAIMQLKTISPLNNQMKKYLGILLLEHQFSPNTNAMETITQSAEIPLLDTELQTAILDYYALIEDTREREHISNTQIQTKYEILINSDYPEIFQSDNDWEFMKSFYQDDPRPVQPLNPAKLLNDKKLEAVLVSRYYQSTALKELYTRLLLSSDAILQLLEKGNQ